MTAEHNGLARMQIDEKYRDSDKHKHNQKIMQMVLTGAVAFNDKLQVTHQLTCALLYSSRDYCNCDPIIKIKPRILT